MNRFNQMLIPIFSICRMSNGPSGRLGARTARPTRRECNLHVSRRHRPAVLPRGDPRLGRLQPEQETLLERGKQSADSNRSKCNCEG